MKQATKEVYAEVRIINLTVITNLKEIGIFNLLHMGNLIQKTCNLKHEKFSPSFFCKFFYKKLRGKKFVKAVLKSCF